MNRFTEISGFAKQLGIGSVIEQMEQRAQAINCREKTGCIITGGMNCGKTTILNGIVGVPLREPSMISNEEKPLRVMFEKAEDSEQFACRIVANKRWYDEDAILYEMKLTDLIGSEGTPTQMLDHGDIVFYVVSALSPFTAEDRDSIKALSANVKVKVVFNKLDLVDAASKEKIRNYAIAMCKEFSVGEPIVLDAPDWEQTAREFRNALPTVAERMQWRKAHIDALVRESANAVMKEAGKQLNSVEVPKRMSKLEQMKKQIKEDERQSMWRMLELDLKEAGNDLAEEVRKRLQRQNQILANKLFLDGQKAQFGDAWEEALPQRMKRELEALAQDVCKIIDDTMEHDFRNTVERAVNLELAAELSYDDAFSRITLREHSGRVNSANVTSPEKTANYKLLIGTGVAAGIAYYLPLPPVVSLVGVIAAIGAGSALYLKDLREEREKAWKTVLDQYAAENIKSLSNLLCDRIWEYYGQFHVIIRANASVAARQEAQDDKEAERLHCEKSEKMNAILQQCGRFLK